MFAKRSQAFASVRKRPQASASVRKRSQASASVGECRASSGVANRRETQNRRHFFRLAFQKCQQSQGSGGAWSQNAELSSLLDSSRVFASQKFQQSQGSGRGRGRKTQTCRQPVVTVGLVSGLRVSKVSTVTGIGGGSWSQNADLSSACRHFWTRLGSSRLKVSTVTGIGGVVVAKRRPVSSLLDSPLERGMESGKERGERRKER